MTDDASTRRLRALEAKWREISSRPNRPTGFLICADDLAAVLDTEGDRQADVSCEACDAGYRLVADGIHYDDARGGQTWGVCRKVVEQLRSKAPPMKPVCPLRYNCFPPRADTEGDARPVRVTRLEVIGPNGRIFSKWDCGIQLSYQDGGRKLKVFVDWQPLPDPPVQP